MACRYRLREVNLTAINLPTSYRHDIGLKLQAKVLFGQTFSEYHAGPKRRLLRPDPFGGNPVRTEAELYANSEPVFCSGYSLSKLWD